MTDLLVEEDVPARMRDGVVLRADVYRPASGGPYPVVLVRLPYGKNNHDELALLRPVEVARHGLIVVLQDTRGRYASEGEWDPLTWEESDGHDSVRWAATLPESNGSVGMYGISYMGNTQWMAALSDPPELKAIAPGFTWSDPADGLFARGGAREIGTTLAWSLVQGFDVLTRRHAATPEDLASAMSDLIADFDHLDRGGYREGPSHARPVFARHQLPEVSQDRARRDIQWASAGKVTGRQPAKSVANLMHGGWFDLFIQGTLDNFIAARAAGIRTNLIVGPWSHVDYGPQVGDVNFGLESMTELLGLRGSLLDIQARWLKHELGSTPAERAAEREAPDLPPVLIFVMGRNEWREEQEWPLARAVDHELHLAAVGVLSFQAASDEGCAEYIYDPNDPVPTHGGALYMAPGYRAGPLNQAEIEARADVLTYTTAPLDADLEVTGRVQAYIWGSSDAAEADWVVRLCDVDENGISRNVVDGITRSEGVRGELAEQLVDLWSTSYVFQRGHRIRVQVTSSNFPRWDAPAPDDPAGSGNVRPANIRVAHGPDHLSRVIIPVVADA